jgi:hypothetical protein
LGVIVKTVIIGALLALTAPGAIAQNSAAAAATGPTIASAGTDSLAVARKYTAWFYTGQVDSLRAHQSADAKKNSSPAKTQYWRTAQFSGGAEPFMVRLALTPQGELAGFGFNPRSKAPTIDP